MIDACLLDTCAVIWLTEGATVDPAILEKLALAESSGQRVSISVMTAWEVGMMLAINRIASSKSPLNWYSDALSCTRARSIETTPSILVASSCLPEPVHDDPVDRILIATAREHDLTIAPRDRAILRYGKLGHVKTLPC
jgi:PIN domain nuclease of toxin-antitoxin system